MGAMPWAQARTRPDAVGAPHGRDALQDAPDKQASFTGSTGTGDGWSTCFAAVGRSYKSGHELDDPGEGMDATGCP